jgi:hypothetical protein
MAALAAILLPSTLTAQITFQRTYGGPADDLGNSAQQTTDGGSIVCGYSQSFGHPNGDFYLVKTDSFGDTLWTMTYGKGGQSENWANSVEQTTDGGYVVTGYTCNAEFFEVYLVKTSADGDTLWTRTFGDTLSDSQGEAVRQTLDGGYIVAGLTNSHGAGSYDVYLIKTNGNGDTLWTRTYGGSSDDEGSSVQQTADSGYIITGGNGDVYLIKTDANGDTLWTRTFGGDSNDYGECVRQTTDGGYVIAGFTRSFGAGMIDVYLIRTDAHGDTLWTRTYGGTNEDLACSVQQTTGGGYIVAGRTSSFGAGGGDVWLIRTNANGDTLWTRTFGGTANDASGSVQQTTDGGYVIAGITDSYGAGGADVYLIKTDSLGRVAVEEPKASPTRRPNLTITCQPNPATGTTTIHLTPFASRRSPLALRIFDAQGRLVRSFSSLLSPPSSLTWDGADDFGQPLPSGAYFVRCDVAGQHATARLVVQR